MRNILIKIAPSKVQNVSLMGNLCGCRKMSNGRRHLCYTNMTITYAVVWILPRTIIYLAGCTTFLHLPAPI